MKSMGTKQENLTIQLGTERVNGDDCDDYDNDNDIINGDDCDDYDNNNDIINGDDCDGDDSNDETI